MFVNTVSPSVVTVAKFYAAKDAYERVLKETPNHAKVLQQLGWLHHHNAGFGNQDVAIQYLMRSIDAGKFLAGECFEELLTSISQIRVMGRRGICWAGVT